MWALGVHYIQKLLLRYHSNELEKLYKHTRNYVYQLLHAKYFSATGKTYGNI